MEYLSLPISRRFCDRRYSVRRVSVDTDCNKRGQTSRSVVGAEIQTNCNSEARLCDRSYILAFVHCSGMSLGSFWNAVVIYWYMMIVVSFSLATSIFSYTKISSASAIIKVVVLLIKKVEKYACSAVQNKRFFRGR